MDEPNPELQALLAAAMDGKLTPAEFFPQLSRHLTTVFGFFYPPEDSHSLPKLAITSRDPDKPRRAHLFIDPRHARVFEPLTILLRELDTLQALRTILRADVEQALLDFDGGSIQLGLDHIRLLVRDYTMYRLFETRGAWVPTKNASLLIAMHNQDMGCIPAFLSQADCQPLADSEGGTPVLHTWDTVWRRCAEVPFDVDVMLHYGMPEEIAIQRGYVGSLCGDGRMHPLDKLEHAVENSMRIGNALAVWRAMAKLDRIWAVIDSDGDMVSFARIGINLFTSATKAMEVIGQTTKRSNLVPRLLPAQPLFAQLVSKRPNVWINQDWFGLADTLPQVLRLAREE